jgi:phosphohistidine phosphatase SixA
MRTLPALSLALFAILASPALAAGDEALWQKLGDEPNLVVLMRHTERAGGRSTTWDQSGKCNGEAMLTGEGKAHARRIGEAFRARAIKPLVVLSSPMCRCLDTARLAFQVEPVQDATLREIGSGDSKRAAEFEVKALSLVAESRGASPVVLVGHQPNIELISFELVEYGDLLVARANERGELTVLGRLHVK